MTSPNRPPSCDKLKSKLKECPACSYMFVQIKRMPDSVHCTDCCTVLPLEDWNSIPRRSEVNELLRLVDEALVRTNYNTSDWVKYAAYAAKLRKEWGL